MPARVRCNAAYDHFSDHAIVSISMLIWLENAHGLRLRPKKYGKGYRILKIFGEKTPKLAQNSSSQLIIKRSSRIASRPFFI